MISPSKSMRGCVILAALLSVSTFRLASGADDPKTGLPTIEALRQRWKTECENDGDFWLVVKEGWLAYGVNEKPREGMTLECYRIDGKRIRSVRHPGKPTLRVAYNPETSLGFEINGAEGDSRERDIWLLADVQRLSLLEKGEAAIGDDLGYSANNMSYGYKTTSSRYECGPYAVDRVPLHVLLAPERVTSLGLSHGNDGSIFIDAMLVDDREHAQRGNGDFLSGHIRRLRAALDPDHYCLREVDIEFNGETGLYKKLRSVYQYDEKDGALLPTSIETYLVDRDTGTEYGLYARYKEYQRDPPIGDEIFTLEYYGLRSPPEARAAGSYRTSMWFYYFIGGVLLTAAGGFAVYRVARAPRGT